MVGALRKLVYIEAHGYNRRVSSCCVIGICFPAGVFSEILFSLDAVGFDSNQVKWG